MPSKKDRKKPGAAPGKSISGKIAPAAPAPAKADVLGSVGAPAAVRAAAAARPTSARLDSVEPKSALVAAPQALKTSAARPEAAKPGASAKAAGPALTPIAAAAKALPAPPVSDAPPVRASAPAAAETLRSFADAGLNQARDAFAMVRDSTDRPASGIDRSAEAGARRLQAFGSSLLEAMQTNADAMFGLIKAMASVKTLSEAIELQSRHARMQFEAMTAQARQLSSIFAHAANETVEPFRKAS